jgi:hypothetical protein
MRVKLALENYIKLNQPLPWDVLSAQGMLLLSKGTIPTDLRQLNTLIEHGAFVDADEYNRHLPTAPEPAPPPVSPFGRWDEIHQRLGNLLRRYQSEPQFIDKLIQLSGDIQSLAEKDSDAAIFAMMRLNQDNYPIAHALQVAVCCDIYAGFLQWDAAERSILVKGSLTMNLAMLDLQRVMAKQGEPPTPEQRAEINSHPTRARDWLKSAGVTDEAWLRAVAEHHETCDGKGYPQGIKEVFPAAEVINIADRYCALMSSRRGRDAMVSNKAARELYLLTTGSLQGIIARMVKAVGLFPPGNFVKLANSEIAVVVHRGEHANKPRVATVISPFGTKLIDPIFRDSAKAEFAITHVVPESSVAVQIDSARLFGYKN